MEKDNKPPCVVRGVMHSGKKWCSALWSNAMPSGKNDEFQNLKPLFYIFLLYSDYVAACLLH